MVESFPLLAMDFQIIITGKGNIFQFDLDRVFLGGEFYNGQFEAIFVKAYNKVMKQLRGFESFCQGSTSRPEGGDFGGESIIMKYNHSSNLQFARSASEIVHSMKGRHHDNPKPDLPDTPRNMMIDLVQTITKVPCL